MARLAVAARQAADLDRMYDQQRAVDVPVRERAGKSDATSASGSPEDQFAAPI
jgi:hypothetical protein